MDEQKMHSNICRCPHHKMMPLMIMLIGFAFLLGELGMVSMHTVGIIWPILVIIAAGTKMNEDKCTCCMKPM